jgi:hypothetical protein
MGERIRDHDRPPRGESRRILLNTATRTLQAAHCKLHQRPPVLCLSGCRICATVACGEGKWRRWTVHQGVGIRAIQKVIARDIGVDGCTKGVCGLHKPP